jgi:hypothetical protein
MCCERRRPGREGLIRLGRAALNFPLQPQQRILLMHHSSGLRRLCVENTRRFHCRAFHSRLFLSKGSQEAGLPPAESRALPFSRPKIRAKGCGEVAWKGKSHYSHRTQRESLAAGLLSFCIFRQAIENVRCTGSRWSRSGRWK